MIAFVEIPCVKVIGIQVTGKIDKQDIERIVEAIRDMMRKTDERLGIYVELRQWQGISLDALFEDIKFGIPNFNRFAKKAVVSDKKWVAALADIGKLFPGLEVRVFPFEEKQAALEWIQQ